MDNAIKKEPALYIYDIRYFSIVGFIYSEIISLQYFCPAKSSN